MTEILTFHFSFVVDYDAGVVFEIYEDAVFPPYGFPLPYDDRRHDYNQNKNVRIRKQGHYCPVPSHYCLVITKVLSTASVFELDLLITCILIVLTTSLQHTQIINAVTI